MFLSIQYSECNRFLILFWFLRLIALPGSASWAKLTTNNFYDKTYISFNIFLGGFQKRMIIHPAKQYFSNLIWQVNFIWSVFQIFHIPTMDPLCNLREAKTIRARYVTDKEH